MGNTLFAIGEALIDFIPAQTGCAFEEVTAFSPKSGGAPANGCGAVTILGGSSMRPQNLSLSLVMTHSEER